MHRLQWQNLARIGRTPWWAVPWLLVVWFALFWAGAAQAQDNGGLGPLSIRNQFPVKLPYLAFTPTAPLTLREGEFQARYQFAFTNAFINTQSPETDAVEPEVITAPDVDAGLDHTHFPDQGYGVYIDLEFTRHLFRFDYGLTPSLEVGLELAWITVDSGFFDPNINSVERVFAGVNPDRRYSRMNQFDFYIYHDNQPVLQTTREFSREFQDPVLNLKWNLTPGGALLPAITGQFSYKHNYHTDPKGASAIVNSGGADYGTHVLVAKQVGNVVGHFQFGRSVLDVRDRPFSNEIRTRLFALEFRRGKYHSWLLQSVTQTSIFDRHITIGGISDFSISRQTDVAVMGYKFRGETYLFELGAIEDYNQQRNESDISFYFEWGGAW